MNSLDIFVLAVIGICVVVGYFRGFVKTCFSFVPSVVSLLLTNKIYPVFSKFLRTTPVYGYIENGVAKALNLESMTSAISAQSNDYINSLSIPDFLKESLISNNNPVVYGILDATGINEYISGYVANMILNILSMIVVAVGLIVIFKLVLILLDVVTKLPVIHGINSVGGLIVGLLEGVLIVWVVFVVAVLFVSGDSLTWFYESLENSKIALALFNGNILLKMILRIIA